MDVSVEQSETGYLQSYSAQLDEVAQRRATLVHSVISPPARCLDFGASYGLIAEHLARRGYDIATFEKSPQALESMRRRGIQAYDEISSLPRQSFDVVTSWHVLEHLQEPQEILRALHTSLRPNGHLLIAVPNAESLFARLSFDHWVWTMPWHLHYFTQNAVERMLERAGFEVRSTYTDLGDVAALELLIGGIVLRAPSRLSRQGLPHNGDGGNENSLLRRVGAPVLRRISDPLQRLAKRAGRGEEIVVHAVKV